MAVIVFLSALAGLKLIPFPMLVLGAMDFIFALWTVLELIRQTHN